MANWRDHILEEFTPRVARLTLVADPDQLLLEEAVHEEIRQRGFHLIVYEDPVAFRYVYEADFRARWDAGEEADLVVVAGAPPEDLNSLPFDVLKRARRLSFRLADLFPNLNGPVVASLDRAHLDALFEAQKHYPPDSLGETATKEYLLRHVFEIAPELVKTPADLLRILLRRHYMGQRVPRVLDEHFIHLMRQKGIFENWPLEAVIPDRNAFFSFLQEGWSSFLDNFAARTNNQDGIQEPIKTPPHRTDPDVLPFDHHDIRVYVDNLFVEGLLKPVEHRDAPLFAATWVRHGVKTSPEEARRRRLEGLLNVISRSLPDERARHEEWLRFAQRWAELSVLVVDSDDPLPEEHRERLEGLTGRVDTDFTGWAVQRYGSLVNLPPDPPPMVHHIPRYLARKMDQDRSLKPALVLVDGLALDQWFSLRRAMEIKDQDLLVRENTVFAWIPTTTSVSRQAAFAGKAPLFFQDSLHGTAKEPKLWNQFWEEQGLKHTQVGFAKGLEDGAWDEVSELLAQPELRVLGLVVLKVDKIMHGMELGAAGMHNQIRQWVQQGAPGKLLRLLHEHGFTVYVTSDHGNIEARGIGNPGEGAVADLRGERVRVYPDPRLRANVKAKFPSALEWDPIGLPHGYWALIAPPRTAFVSENKTVVAHGGISIEEVIVPFVQIDRKKPS